MTHEDIRKALLEESDGPKEVRTNDGRVFFVVSAPDEAAVRRQHTHQGVVCHRVRRVQSIATGSDELGDDQKAIVRSMIVAEQTGSPGMSSLTTGDERLRHVG